MSGIEIEDATGRPGKLLPPATMAVRRSTGAHSGMGRRRHRKLLLLEGGASRGLAQHFARHRLVPHPEGRATGLTYEEYTLEILERGRHLQIEDVERIAEIKQARGARAAKIELNAESISFAGADIHA